MQVLFLTDNFPPEANAPATRTYEHAKRWVEAGHQVTVITGAPNFPEGKLFAGYRNELWHREHVDGIDVIRVWTYITANSGVARRSLDYVSFMVSAIIASLFVRRPDVIVATSPQFFTACAGWVASVLRWRPFVFELRDLWPDSILAVGAMKDSMAIRALRRLEYFLYRRATRIVSVTHSFREVLREGGIDAAKIAVIPNGADLGSFQPGPKPTDLVARFKLEGAFIAGYIGTVGMAHGLNTILECAEVLRHRDNIRIIVVGDGAEREELARRAREAGLVNVQFVGPVSRGEVIRFWHLIDVAVVLLRDSPVFRTVLPSKLFEAMATATPIVLGVRGEAAELVDAAAAGVCIPPEDATALAAAIEGLASGKARAEALGRAGQSYVNHHYDRDHLALQMLEELKIAARS